MEYFDYAMIKKRLLSIFIVLGIFGLFLAMPPKPVHAKFCEPDKTMFQNLGNAFQALDIRKTVTNMLFSAATDGIFYPVAGRNLTQTVGCAYWLFKDKPEYADLQLQIHTECPDQVGDASCADIVQTFDGSGIPQGLLPGRRAFNDTRVSGSLIGIANFIEGAGMTEPVPVNLAYYWNDSIRKVPFAGTALAANVQYGNAPFIGFILEMWKITRNLSYGILSIIMLVIGVSIMMRKKLSPQLVVTAQFALPRVVLAVILITFSYPIGAILASSMSYLLALSNGLIYDVAASAGLTSAGANGIGMLISLILVGVLAFVGVAPLIIILITVVIVAALLLYIFIWIKAFMLYFKLIFSIIFAPFAFALGAIPGNEQSTGKWFRSAISNVLGFVATVAYAHMVLVILFIAISKGSSAPSFGAQLGSAAVVLFFPVFVIFGFIQATKVPGKINTMIMGEEKKPGGKR